MKRIEANRLRFEIGELAGCLPDEFVWQQHLLSQFVDRAEFRSKQGDRVRFTIDNSGHVFCDVEPHDLTNDWSVPIDQAVAKAVAAVKRIVRTKDFQHFVNAFHTFRYLEHFFEKMQERLDKRAREHADWAVRLARTKE
jgi:hypothetical protein